MYKHDLRGGARQRAAKQEALEEERQARLERLKSENAREVGTIRAEAKESLHNAEETWDAERKDLERELTAQVRCCDAARYVGGTPLCVHYRKQQY